MKKVLSILIILLTLTLVACQKEPDEQVVDEGRYQDSLKVLAIGNSFSDDSLDELWKIATSWGIPEVKVGILYIGGTSLEDHDRNIMLGNSGNHYTYFKYQGVNRTSVPTVTINYGITDEDWDVIMIQQVSGLSGKYETYSPYIDRIISYIKEHKTNEDVEIVFNMTWAYAKTSNHADYWRYENNQMTMYEQIVSAAIKVDEDFEDIAYVLPTGTAIQNARPFIGDHNMTRDGYHLNASTGRYIAAMSVFKKITRLNLDEINHRPIGMTVENANKVKQAVEAAYNNPYIVTEIN